MDIEPLWAIGGWLFLLSTCMAEAKTSSSSLPISQKIAFFSKKSYTFLQFLTLLFILFLLINFSHTPSSMASLDPTKSPSSSESTMSSSTTNLHPHHKSSHSSSKKPGRDQFGADAHEVPSGPNPIQN